MYQFIHNKKKTDLFCQYFTYSNDIFKYSTRNSANYNLYLPQFSSNRTQRCIKYVGAKIWKNIPIVLNNFPTLNLNIFTNNTSYKSIDNIYIYKKVLSFSSLLLCSLH